MTNLYLNFANALAEKTGISEDAAQKVVTWLITEGVLDAPVVSEEFSDEGGTVVQH